MSDLQNGFEVLRQYAFEVVDFSSQYGSERGTGYNVGNLVGPCQVYPNYCDSNAACSFRTYGRWWYQSPSALEPIGSKPDGYTSEDYVDLFFDIPVVPTRLQIFETFNPGSIVRIMACYRTQPADGPVNTRCLKWITLWRAPLVQRKRTNTDNICNRLQLPYQSSPEDTGDRSLALSPIRIRHRFSRRLSGEYSLSDLRERYSIRQNQQPIGRARIFQPLLVNVPPYPTDLIRLEIDGSRCPYFPQLDAVLLTGFTRIQPPGWPGYSQLEAGATVNIDGGTHSDRLQDPIRSTRPGPALSFFSDLLRPRTPQICLPDTIGGERADLSLSLSSLSPAPSPDASPVRLPSDWTWLFSRLQCNSGLPDPLNSTGQLTVPSTLCRLPPVGWNRLIPHGSHIVAVPPGTICPASLFGLTHVDETAFWRHGPITRLPYEILLHIFSYLDLQTLCRAARVSRQFRCLADDALARVRDLNLQAYWPWLSDTGLLSLGKRLGCVNLAARAAAAFSTGNDVAPFTLLRRRQKEEGQSAGAEDDLELPEDEGLTASPIHSPRPSRPTTLAARVRSVSRRARAAAAAAVLTKRNLSSETEEVMDYRMEEQPHATNRFRLSREWLDAFHSAFAVCRLRRLDISWCGNYSQFTPTAFGHFLEDCCRQLTTFRLSSCKFLNDDCLLHIVNTCGFLRELDLSSCTGISAHGFLTLGRLIHLRWLSLYRTRITDAGLLSLAGLCQYLEHINLGSCMDIQDMDNVLDHLTRNNTHIRSINLWRCVTVSSVGIDHLTRSCSELQELDLGWCRNVTITPEVNCITRLVQQCRQIRKLFLSGTSLLNADDLVLVAQCLGPNLEQMDIQSSININTLSVATLLGHCPRLRLLDLSFCANVPLYSVVRLRQLFPTCTIICSVRGFEADENEHPAPRMVVDELLDDLDNPADQLFGLRALWPRALPGGPELLALPAPHPLAAIAGPSSAAAVD